MGARPWTRSFELVGFAWAAVVASLILRDPRPTSWERVVLVVGLLIGVAVPVERILGARGVRGDTVGALSLLACALLTYRVGGLAFLVPALFFGLAAAAGALSPEEGSRRDRRAVGWTIIGVAVLLLPLSMFDPGDSAIVVVPVFIPLVAWASLLRAQPPTDRS